MAQITLKIRLPRGRETFQSSTYRGHKNPFDVGLVPKSSKFSEGKATRYGSTGASIQDGYVFGKDWAKKKDTQSLQKYVVISWDWRTEKIVSWEYFHSLEKAKETRDYYERAGWLSAVFDRRGHGI